MSRILRFDAVDENGNVESITGIKISIDSTTLDSENKERMRTGYDYDFTTADGRRVNHTGKGKYEIVDLPENIRLTTDDPNAP